MDALTVQLDRLEDGPVAIEFDFAPEGMEVDGEDLRFPVNVTGRVVFQRAGDDVVAHGRLATEAEGPCARCLVAARAKLKADVDELWVRKKRESKGRDDDDEREEEIEPDLAHPLEGDKLELREIFRELILAEAPDRFLCKADCKGLCPGCGANLNEEACRCPQTGEPAVPAKIEPEWKKKLRDVKLGE